MRRSTQTKASFHPYASPEVEPKQRRASNTKTASTATAENVAKRKFICNTCDKAFTTSGHLARHVRIHTGEKNYACPYPGCTIRCSRQDNLQQHYRIHLAPGSRRGKKVVVPSAAEPEPSPEPVEEIDESQLPPLSPIPALVPARLYSMTPPDGSIMTPSPEIKKEPFYGWASPSSSVYETASLHQHRSSYDQPKMSYESSLSEVFQHDVLAYPNEATYSTDANLQAPLAATYSDTSSIESSSPAAASSYDQYGAGDMPGSYMATSMPSGISRRVSYRSPSPPPMQAALEYTYSTHYQQQPHHHHQQQQHPQNYYSSYPDGGVGTGERVYSNNNTLPPLLLTTPLSSGPYRPRSPVVPHMHHQPHSDYYQDPWRSSHHPSLLQ